jgi:hypothetical protein
MSKMREIGLEEGNGAGNFAPKPLKSLGLRAVLPEDSKAQGSDQGKAGNTGAYCAVELR